MSGCSTILGPGVDSQRLGRGEVPTPLGTPVRDNRTPMEAALACLGDQLAAKGGARPVIAVGDVKDFTGKYSINEGNAITQGGALMVYSALGKVGPSLVVAERFDPLVAERELAYTDKRQLGDGKAYEVNGNRVPWVPYYGGSIRRSDYFIVGGVTELNYDIRSGGIELAVNNIGPKARVFTESVGIDLRIVDSRSLVVVKSVSLAKQFSGYEVGANVFRFFGTALFDINVGAKGQEPVQLGIRTALEEATLRLVAAVAKVSPDACMTQRTDTIPDLSADQLRGRSLRDAARAGQLPASDPADADASSAVPTGPSLNNVAAELGQGSGKSFQVSFEFGDAALAGGAQAVLDEVATQAATGAVSVTLVARDSESWDATKRDTLIDQRIAALVNALGSRGIAAGAIRLTWRPDKADGSIHRASPGLQEIAKLEVRR